MTTTRALIKFFRELAKPLERRVSLMVGRAVVELVNNGLQCQGLQLSILADEVKDDVEHFEHYGFTSFPLKGAEAVVVSPRGDRGNAIAVCVTDRRHRPTNLVEGEAAVFTDEGTYFHAKRGGETLVGIGAAQFAARADRVDAELTAVKGDLDTLKGLLASHTHLGVTVGPGSTGTSAAFASYTPHTPASTAADKVKVK